MRDIQKRQMSGIQATLAPQRWDQEQGEITYQLLINMGDFKQVLFSIWTTRTFLKAELRKIKTASRAVKPGM
jgi:hypothetical protein